jgi:hypothetical protein
MEKNEGQNDEDRLRENDSAINHSANNPVVCEIEVNPSFVLFRLCASCAFCGNSTFLTRFFAVFDGAAIER